MFRIPREGPTLTHSVVSLSVIGNKGKITPLFYTPELYYVPRGWAMTLAGTSRDTFYHS